MHVPRWPFHITAKIINNTFVIFILLSAVDYPIYFVKLIQEVVERKGVIKIIFQFYWNSKVSS